MMAFVVVAICVGVLLGVLIGRHSVHYKKVGTFEINHSDPSTDFCNLILDCDIDVIEKCNTIGLKVRIK